MNLINLFFLSSDTWVHHRFPQGGRTSTGICWKGFFLFREMFGNRRKHRVPVGLSLGCEVKPSPCACQVWNAISDHIIADPLLHFIDLVCETLQYYLIALAFKILFDLDGFWVFFRGRCRAN